MIKSVILFMTALFTSTVHAGDYEKSQHNTRIRFNDTYTIEVRQEVHSKKDHYQLMYTGIKDFEMRYRYVDNPDATEHRPQISYLGWDNGTFFLRPRLDFRYFEGERNDYFSFRTGMGVSKRIENFRVYGDFIPIWNLGQGQVNDTKMDSAQFRIGVEHRPSKNWSYSPFLQYETNRDFEKTEVFLGTMVVYCLDNKP